MSSFDIALPEIQRRARSARELGDQFERLIAAAVRPAPLSPAARRGLQGRQFQRCRQFANRVHQVILRQPLPPVEVQQQQQVGPKAVGSAVALHATRGIPLWCPGFYPVPKTLRESLRRRQLGMTIWHTAQCHSDSAWIADCNLSAHTVAGGRNRQTMGNVPALGTGLRTGLRCLCRPAASQVECGNRHEACHT